MKMVIDTAARKGVDTVIMGMPHRFVTNLCFKKTIPSFNLVVVSMYLQMSHVNH
jgi:hypothetical protein